MNKKIFNGIFILGVITMSLLAAEKQNKRLFILTQKNMPPFSAYRRLESKGEYNQEIVFLFTNKSNKKDFIPVIYTKKKYKRLFIRDYKNNIISISIIYNKNNINNINRNQCFQLIVHEITHGVEDLFFHYNMSIELRNANNTIENL